MHPQAQPNHAFETGVSSGERPRGGLHAQAGRAMRGEETTRSVVVLDDAVSDPCAFLRVVPPGFAVVRLGPSADPLGSLLRALGGAPLCSSLHIVSHGRPGALMLAG